MRGDGVRLCVETPMEFLARANHGSSIAVMGVCLTVASKGENYFEADLSAETISTTTLGELPIGIGLHLEPAVSAGDPLDGHLVSGHVDAVGQLIQRPSSNGLWRFSMPSKLSPTLAPKGSVAVDGVSLTVVDVGFDFFSVAIIPETVASTEFKYLKPGDRVNIETDPIGRYVARFLSLSMSGERLTKFASEGWDG